MSCSKPWKVGKRELTAMDVHATQFGAAVQGWKYLAGIEQALRVEGAFQSLLLVEIDLAEHFRHQVALLDADAMFAGKNAAEFDTDPQDIGAEGFGPFDLTGLVGIIQDQRMQIAVAGMKHVGDAEIVLSREVADSRQGLRQFAARDSAVHAEIIRRDPPDGRKCRLAAGPEQIALNFRSGNLESGRAAALRDRLDAADQLIHFDAGTIEFDDQKRLDVERVAGMNEGFGSVDRRFVHHLHAAWNDPGADDPRHALPGRLDLREANHQRPRGFRLPQYPHRDLGNDAEQAF